jgi:hypothetical protein
MLLERNKPAAAEPLLRGALEIRRAIHTSPHEEIADTPERLAAAVDLMGRTAESITLVRELLVLERKLKGDQHADVASHTVWLAQLLVRDGAHDEAVAALRRAIAAGFRDSIACAATALPRCTTETISRRF